MNIIGKKIRDLRIEKKLTQEEFTVICQLAGWNISRGTLAKIESARRQITDKEVKFFADVLNVSESKLFEK